MPLPPVFRPSECCQALLYTKPSTPSGPLSGRGLNVFRVTIQEPPPGEGFDSDAFVNKAEKEGFTVLGFGSVQEIDKMEEDLRAVAIVHEA